MFKSLFAFALCVVAPSSLAQAYLEVDGIPGDSQQQGYENQIDVLDWSQGVANLGDGAVVLPFRFTHEFDIASPLLAQAALTSSNLRFVRLSAARLDGAEPFEYLSLELTNARIVSVKTRNDPTVGAVEEVTVDCSSFTLSYIPQLGNGMPGTPVTTTGSCGQ